MAGVDRSIWLLVAVTGLNSCASSRMVALLPHSFQQQHSDPPGSGASSAHDALYTDALVELYGYSPTAAGQVMSPP